MSIIASLIIRAVERVGNHQTPECPIGIPAQGTRVGLAVDRELILVHPACIRVVRIRVSVAGSELQGRRLARRQRCE